MGASNSKKESSSKAAGKERRPKGEEEKKDDNDSDTKSKPKKATTTTKKPTVVENTILSGPNWICIDRDQSATFLVRDPKKPFPYYLFVKEGGTVTFKKAQPYQGGVWKNTNDDDNGEEQEVVIINKEIWGAIINNSDNNDTTIRFEDCKGRIEIEMGTTPPHGILTANFITFDPDEFEKSILNKEFGGFCERVGPIQGNYPLDIFARKCPYRSAPITSYHTHQHRVLS